MGGEMRPYFSIIVPVYNREDFIHSLIQSVLEQQFKDFELIIVNDGSTDYTEERIKTFSDSRIRYVKIENRERGAARNRGAEVATGFYFNFFDSDDMMYRHHLQTAHSFIQQNVSPPWFHVGYDIIDEQGKRITTEIGVESNPERKLIITNYLACNSVFIQRELFLENQFNENRKLSSSEDWELWLRVISRKDLLACREVTFKLIQHNSRSLSTIHPDRVIERDTFMLTELMRDDAFTRKFKRDLSLFEADRYTFFALTLVLVKRRTETFSYLLKSVITTPWVVKRKRFWACIKLLTISFIK
jgi:glycosyltransferase involved in cell wall biosynthesis